MGLRTWGRTVLMGATNSAMLAAEQTPAGASPPPRPPPPPPRPWPAAGPSSSSTATAVKEGESFIVVVPPNSVFTVALSCSEPRDPPRPPETLRAFAKRSIGLMLIPTIHATSERDTEL